MKKFLNFVLAFVVYFLFLFLIMFSSMRLSGWRRPAEDVVEPSLNLVTEVVEMTEATPIETYEKVVIMNEENYTIEIEPIPYNHLFTEEDVDIIARTIYGEAGGIGSRMEQAAVAWCILNRVDRYDSTVKAVVTPDQFHGYIYWGSCPEEFYELAEDVLIRWEREKNGEVGVGRILPKDYYYFYGDGKHNHFRQKFEGSPRWDWSYWNPYES